MAHTRPKSKPKSSASHCIESKVKVAHVMLHWTRAMAFSDGHEGLISAIARELPGVSRQRCTVHKVRNVVGRSPRHLKAIAPKEASAIWKAPNKSEAKSRAAEFIAKYKDAHPVLAANNR